MLRLLLALLAAHAVYAFSCLDQNGKPVDWFAVYKMPIEASDNSVPGIKQGTAWYYADAHSPSKLVASQVTLDKSNHALAYTLQQYYARKDDKTIFHVMYNDEPYGTAPAPPITLEELLSNRIGVRASASDYGHTKGTIFFDTASGVWLIHSVPKFPNPVQYEYPDSGTDYGQTMLCLSLKYSELAKIGTQLYYNRPNIYSSLLPQSMVAQNPDLAKAISGQYKTGSPSSSIIDLVTVAGVTFKTFAKTKEFNMDLYDSLVAPTLKTDLLVESWRRGDLIPLACSAAYHANDVLSVQVGTTGVFSYTKDHSKMARSTSSATPYICIGDINRMTSQYTRGGGTACTSMATLWSAFNVAKTENNC